MAERLSGVEIRRLDGEHLREGFDYGEPALNRYLLRQAAQDERRGLARVFVATLGEDPAVLGFYALSASSVACERLSGKERAKLPRYPIPTARLGRLAVALSAQGRGLGKTLLMDALSRVVKLSEEVAVYAVEVEAKDARARVFYERYGFEGLRDDVLHLYRSIKAVRRAFGR